MEITKEEYESLELIYNTFCSQLRIKDNFLLKKNRYNSSETRLIFDYLFGKPYIENSGEPIDDLIIDEEYKGIVMYYFKDAIPFAKASHFLLDKKIKAITDTDNQLNTLHRYDLCFNDVHTSNLLIDSNGGHLIDFDSVTFGDEDISYVRFYLSYKDENFDVSFNADNYKALISYFSLIYGIELEEALVKDGLLDLSLLEELLKGTSIFPLIVVANKNLLLDCPIPNIADFLPFVSDLDRVNYDTHLIKSKVLR